MIKMRIIICTYLPLPKLSKQMIDQTINYCYHCIIVHNIKIGETKFITLYIVNPNVRE